MTNLTLPCLSNNSMRTINYKHISDAIEHYTRLGYEYIEAPWIVNFLAVSTTKPEKSKFFYISHVGHLVGSGEQSFIEIRKKLEKDKKYICVTPCFRDDDYDKYHFPYFLKAELIHAFPKTKLDEHNMFLDALNFFKKYAEPYSVDTDIGKDIMINGLEVGSYGYRSMSDFDWIYGTGVAEPRLSQSLKN